MFEKYYSQGEIRSEFCKEYISLWSGWLGKEKLHLLDLVTKKEWEQFNSLILAISNNFDVGTADRNSQTISVPPDIRSTFKSHVDSLNSSADSFAQYVIPQLECVITEDWDYTYILWHQDNGALQALQPFIAGCQLKHFSE